MGTGATLPIAETLEPTVSASAFDPDEGWKGRWLHFDQGGNS